MPLQRGNLAYKVEAERGRTEVRSGWTRLLQRRRGVGVGLFIMHKPQAVTTPTHPLKGGSRLRQSKSTRGP
jgi:hypothetical protein